MVKESAVVGELAVVKESAVVRESLWCGSLVWRGSLLPLGREAALIRLMQFSRKKRICLFWGCFATQREQAPSPQTLPHHKLSHTTTLSLITASSLALIEVSGEVKRRASKGRNAGPSPPGSANTPYARHPAPPRWPRPWRCAMSPGQSGNSPPGSSVPGDCPRQNGS